MFRQEKYLKKDPYFIFEFIKQHPFATFIIKGESLLATHIPVLLKGDASDFVLYGHIAQANEQYKHLQDGMEALVIFNGAHSYVSSSWYKEMNISTWDYSAVHVNVTIKVQSREELEESLQNLVRHFEKEQKEPIYYEDYPKEMVQDHLPLIRGFWCEPKKIQAIAKLHQGFDRDDVHSVTQHLEGKKDPLALELSKRIRKEHDTDN